jgi:hypothetical protein
MLLFEGRSGIILFFGTKNLNRKILLFLTIMLKLRSKNDFVHSNKSLHKAACNRMFILTVKKVSPARVRLVNGIPAGDGKSVIYFYSVCEKEALTILDV